MTYLIESVLPVLVLLVSTFLLYRWYLRRNHFWAGKPIPSVPPTPFLGILLQSLLGKPIQDIDMNLYKKYGKLFGAYNGTEPCIFVSERDLIRSIYVKDFHIFSARRELNFRNPIIDSMVGVIKEGNQWKNIRSTMTPAFSTGKINKMIPIFSACAQFTLSNFEEFSRQKQSVDIQRLFGNFTVDVIANVAFGTRLDPHNNPVNEFVNHAKTISMQNLNIKAIIAFYFPKIGKMLGVEIVPAKSLEFFSNLVNTIIDRRIKDNEVRNDFLQIMINSFQAGEVETADTLKDEDESDSPVPTVVKIKRKPLTRTEVLAQCIAFFFAGYETMSTTLTLVAYYLAVNPEIKKKAVKEVDQIWSKWESLDAEAIHEAKYIDAVLDETMRIAPSTIRIGRIANEDYVLGDTGITIPKGMEVLTPIYPIHHDKEYFPEPEKFRPERFLKGEEKPVEPYSFLPFGAGPRNCIAMRLARVEAKLCLLHVLKRFDFFPCELTNIPLQFGQAASGMLSPKTIYLKVTERTIG